MFNFFWFSKSLKEKVSYFVVEFRTISTHPTHYVARRESRVFDQSRPAVAWGSQHKMLDLRTVGRVESAQQAQKNKDLSAREHSTGNCCSPGENKRASPRAGAPHHLVARRRSTWSRAKRWRGVLPPSPFTRYLAIALPTPRCNSAKFNINSQSSKRRS